MPSYAVPDVPLPLLHPTFGEFLATYRGHGEAASPEDYAFVRRLTEACSKFYPKEDHRRQAMLPVLQQYLGDDVVEHPMLYQGCGNIRPDIATAANQVWYPGAACSEPCTVTWHDDRCMPMRLRNHICEQHVHVECNSGSTAVMLSDQTCSCNGVIAM